MFTVFIAMMVSQVDTHVQSSSVQSLSRVQLFATP